MERFLVDLTNDIGSQSSVNTRDSTDSLDPGQPSTSVSHTHDHVADNELSKGDNEFLRLLSDDIFMVSSPANINDYPHEDFCL